MKIADQIKKGDVGVLATDTLYGLVGLAENKPAVQRIYDLKNRDPRKPLIILISNIDQLKLFKVEIDDSIKQELEQYWPGPVSIILKCENAEFEYLHRGTNSLAFRLPDKPELCDIIDEAGPLVAPSANPEGMEPPINIQEARDYFKDKADFYQEGNVSNKPSTIIDLTAVQPTILRP